jgi:hypothetical protein
MRKTTLALVMTLGLTTGCSAVKSGMSALGGGKPHQVTVVNNIEAPQPQVVVVQAPTVAAVEPAIVVEPTPLAQLPAPKKSRISAIKAVASGAVAGALVGTAVGYAIDGSDGAAKGAAIGAGAGAVGGAAAHRAR